ncbi:hypothetical protein EII17_09825 [Clostridiales bacterium COT073_COT-073]|nr:hypothetical protein EII17_09825 [Clostridiales bacterium COT073_COT-073]
MLLPARMAVLNRLSKVESASIEQMMEALRPEYGHEKQFNYNDYLEHMMALEANGYATLKKYEVDGNGKIILFYGITEDGKVSVEKYVPAQYR